MATAAKKAQTGYVYPFGYSVVHSPSFRVGRVDQGVDFEAGSANVGQGILALGSGTYLGEVPDPGGFGPTEIAYRLDKATGLPSNVVYVGHSRSLGLKPGQHISAGQPVALIQGGGAYGGELGHSEIGFGTPGSPFLPLGHAQAAGSATHYTQAGQAFSAFLNNAAGNVNTQTGNVGGGELIPGSGNIGASGNSPTAAAKGVSSALGLSSLADLIRWLTDPKNLTRIAEVIAGAVLILVGTILLGKASGATRTVQMVRP